MIKLQRYSPETMNRQKVSVNCLKIHVLPSQEAILLLDLEGLRGLPLFSSPDCNCGQPFESCFFQPTTLSQHLRKISPTFFSTLKRSDKLC